jgi:prevent-host-death family protein
MPDPITFTELRNNAKKYFDAVENGTTLEVYRNGKPVALVSPIRSRSIQRWKSAKPLRLSGASLSHAILTEREDS